MTVEIREDLPSIDDFLRLRAENGLTPRSRAAAEAGLPKSIAAVTAWDGETCIGMARATGDALTWTVADVAVDAAHRRQGIADRMLSVLMARLRRIAPAEVYVSLVADLPADALYARHGFGPVAPRSIGMAQWLRPDEEEAAA